jgi:N-acetyl-1-D-myo-inositol-2-amino-2-deoxy-alpha-D-glucopyranoside deacetylase
MTAQKTLIFVGAHPDDETFGMGATLAKYARHGVRVYYICATRGEAGTVEPEFLKGYAGISEMRSAELNCAAGVLGLTNIIHLNYRDSGMPGSPDNQNLAALVQAPLSQVVGRLVTIFRDLKPDVIITHDPSGGYQHPDHIVVHNATRHAFFAAGDARSFPAAGPPFQPAKLFYGIRPNRLMRFVVRLMPLLGQNPHKFGRNGDIDLTKLVNLRYPIHAAVRLSKADLDTRIRAAACHASQGGGRFPPRERGLFGFLFFWANIAGRIFGYYDYYMRAYPSPDGKRREADLFQSLP